MAKLAEDALQTFSELRAGVYNILSKLNEQIQDAGLWSTAETGAESYLQEALRELHHSIESNVCDLVEHPAFRETGSCDPTDDTGHS